MLPLYYMHASSDPINFSYYKSSLQSFYSSNLNQHIINPFWYVVMGLDDGHGSVGTDKQPHFVLFPFMAPGHMIPMLDIARLLALRGVAVTVLLTPRNATRVAGVTRRAIASGLSIRVAHLRLPCAEAGLPEACENFDMLASTGDVVKFFAAAAMMRDQVEALLRDLNPSCLISDMCFPWTTDVAMALRIPRIVFHGVSSFALVMWYLLETSEVVRNVASDTEYFELPGLPDRVEFTLAQLRGTPNTVLPSPGWLEIRKVMRLAGLRAFGTMINTFTELEPEYVKEYAKAMDKPVWCIGPVSLCNENEFDKAERGGKASIDERQCLEWLDCRKSGSVIYVCLGSLARVTTPQSIELGLALEASRRPFVWVVKNVSDEFNAWLKEKDFENRVKGRGLLIHGWAPQVLILSHSSVGGFLTHCGWNSTMEGITAGVPMVTWPVFAEQFSNEKLVVEVIKTGVRVGVEMPLMFGEEEDDGGVQVTRREIMVAVDKVMDGGDEGEGRRKRARWLSETARHAVDAGGSSYMNITRLIEDVEQAKHEEEVGKDEKLSHENSCAEVVVQ